MTPLFNEADIEAAAKVEYAAWRETSMQFRSDPTPLPTWEECDLELRKHFLDRAAKSITAAVASMEARGAMRGGHASWSNGNITDLSFFQWPEPGTVPVAIIRIEEPKP